MLKNIQRNPREAIQAAERGRHWHQGSIREGYNSQDDPRARLQVINYLENGKYTNNLSLIGEVRLIFNSEAKHLIENESKPTIPPVLRRLAVDLGIEGHADVLVRLAGWFAEGVHGFKQDISLAKYCVRRAVESIGSHQEYKRYQRRLDRLLEKHEELKILDSSEDAIQAYTAGIKWHQGWVEYNSCDDPRARLQVINHLENGKYTNKLSLIHRVRYNFNSEAKHLIENESKPTIPPVLRRLAVDLGIEGHADVLVRLAGWFAEGVHGFKQDISLAKYCVRRAVESIGSHQEYKRYQRRLDRLLEKHEELKILDSSKEEPRTEDLLIQYRDKHNLTNYDGLEELTQEDEKTSEQPEAKHKEEPHTKDLLIQYRDKHNLTNYDGLEESEGETKRVEEIEIPLSPAVQTDNTRSSLSRRQQPANSNMIVVFGRRPKEKMRISSNGDLVLGLFTSNLVSRSSVAKYFKLDSLVFFGKSSLMGVGNAGGEELMVAQISAVKKMYDSCVKIKGINGHRDNSGYSIRLAKSVLDEIKKDNFDSLKKVMEEITKIEGRLDCVTASFSQMSKFHGPVESGASADIIMSTIKELTAHYLETEQQKKKSSASSDSGNQLSNTTVDTTTDEDFVAFEKIKGGMTFEDLGTVMDGETTIKKPNRYNFHSETMPEPSKGEETTAKPKSVETKGIPHVGPKG